MVSALTTQYLPGPEPSWKALRFFSLYRITLAGIFVVFGWSGYPPDLLGLSLTPYFALLASIYLALAFILQLALETQPIRYDSQVQAHVVTDIVILTLLMGASGGVVSGLGMLLGVSIAWSSFLLQGRSVLPLAAFAALMTLAEEWYGIHLYQTAGRNFAQAGLLGSVLFAIAIVSHALARRLGVTEALAVQQSLDLENLSLLNGHIVHRMRSGVVVVNPSGRVELANTSAQSLLGRTEPMLRKSLNAIDPDLNELLRAWQEQPALATRLLRSPARDKDLLVSMTELGSQRGGGTLIFLEDAASMRQRAQQLKLASLGRLAASIAHEIRNPLGAIAHAAQLLSESGDLDKDNRRLLEIILQHSQRVNTVVDNVLKIGRRGTPVLQSFALQPWLQQFVRELTERLALPAATVHVVVVPTELSVRMDPSQLHQVLWNLCDNALRYSRGTPALELRAGVKSVDERPYLDVIDHGPGLPVEISERLFEPFVSRNSPHGTGLGLFIASELCECNQASLSLYSNSSEGCCFRIGFAPPSRQQWMFE